MAQNKQVDDRRATLKHQYKAKEQQLKYEVESLKLQLQEQTKRDARVQTDVPTLRPQGQYDDHSESYGSGFDSAVASPTNRSSAGEDTSSPSVRSTSSTRSRPRSEPGWSPIRSSVPSPTSSGTKTPNRAQSLHSVASSVQDDIPLSQNSPIRSLITGSSIHSSPAGSPIASIADSLIRSSIAGSSIHSSPTASPKLSLGANNVHSPAESPLYSPTESFHSPTRSSGAGSPIRSVADSAIHSSANSPHSRSSIHSERDSAYSEASIRSDSSPRTEKSSPTSSRESQATSPRSVLTSPHSSSASPYPSPSDKRRTSRTSHSPTSGDEQTETETETESASDDDEELNAVLSKLEEEIKDLELLKKDLSAKRGSHFKSKYVQ